MMLIGGGIVGGLVAATQSEGGREWIRTQLKFDPAVVPVGPGDDTAVVMCGSEKLLVTIDQLLDGVMRAAVRAKPIRVGIGAALYDRRQRQRIEGLHGPVLHRGNAQWS